MKNVDDLLDAVKKITGSDYKTAKELKIATQLIGNWRGRRGMPSNRHVIEMCRLASLDIGEAIIAVEYSRENERPLKEAGFGNVAFLGSLSVGSFGAMSIMNMTQLPYEAIGAAMLGASIVYYVKLSKQVKSSINTGNQHWGFKHM